MKDAFESGYHDYKDIHFKKINGIRISKFRTISDAKMDLGNVMTIISGKNGTMKSTILGLLAHPFASPNNAQDAYGNDLKTRHSDVFYLSPDKDKEQYNYSLVATTMDDVVFEEPIRVYPRKNPNGTIRHRLTVGKDNVDGKGNFSLNTSYVNLKRLLPIVGTNAQILDKEIGQSLERFISQGYMKILQKEAFLEPVFVLDKGKKQTFGPGKKAKYDYKAISSGEDNVGHILSKMHAFLQYKSENANELQGIFCIDEMEASLHPVAQINLFNFIYSWAKNNNIQVVINTHSLYLIQYVIELQERMGNKDDIVLNMISTAFVSGENYNIIKNPSYNKAYKELTLKDIKNIDEIYKVNLICEDDVAEYYLRRIISKREVLARVDIIHSLNDAESGNSCNGLKSLIRNGQKLLTDSVIVFDADVNVTDIERYPSKFIVLPGEYNLPLEKEIVKYIYDLPGDHDFFKKFKKERIAFVNEFSRYDIVNLNNIDSITNEKVSKYKNWAKESTKDFKKYVTYYVKDNDKLMRTFKETLQDILNEKFMSQSLPGVNLLGASEEE